MESKITIPANIRNALSAIQRKSEQERDDLKTASCFLDYANSATKSGDSIDFNALSDRCLRMITTYCGHNFERIFPEEEPFIEQIPLYHSLPPELTSAVLKKKFGEKQQKQCLDEIIVPIQYLILKHQALKYPERGRYGGTGLISHINPGASNKEIVTELGRRGLVCSLKRKKTATGHGSLGQDWVVAWSDKEVEAVRLDRERANPIYSMTEFFGPMEDVPLTMPKRPIVKPPTVPKPLVPPTKFPDDFVGLEGEEEEEDDDSDDDSESDKSDESESDSSSDDSDDQDEPDE